MTWYMAVMDENMRSCEKQRVGSATAAMIQQVGFATGSSRGFSQAGIGVGLIFRCSPGSSRVMNPPNNKFRAHAIVPAAITQPNVEHRSC